MVPPVFATFFVDKITESVVQLVLVSVVDIHGVINMIPRERSHYQPMDQPKFVYGAWIYGAMPTSILPLPQDPTSNLATVA